jgi:hypothetical protein
VKSFRICLNKKFAYSKDLIGQGRNAIDPYDQSDSKGHMPFIRMEGLPINSNIQLVRYIVNQLKKFPATANIMMVAQFCAKQSKALAHF